MLSEIVYSFAAQTVCWSDRELYFRLIYSADLNTSSRIAYIFVMFIKKTFFFVCGSQNCRFMSFALIFMYSKYAQSIRMEILHRHSMCDIFSQSNSWKSCVGLKINTNHPNRQVYESNMNLYTFRHGPVLLKKDITI